MSTYPYTVSALFDALQEPAALVDVEGRFTDLNQTFLERAQRRGFSHVKAAWIGRHFWDTPFLRDPQGCEVFVRRALAQGPTGAKGRFIYDFDVEVHMELSLTPLHDPQGQVLGGLVLWKNVTAQVRQEQRRQILPQVREAIWRMGSSKDVVGILVAVRDGLEKLDVPFVNCGVNLVDSAGPEPQVYSHSMTEEGIWLPAKTDDPGSETVLRIWRSKETAYRRDLDREDRYGEAGWIKADFNQPIRSVVDAPFSHGTLAINSTVPDAFDLEDVDALQAMARVLSEGFQRLEDFHLLEARNQDLEQEVAERRQAETALRLAQFTIEHTSEAVFWFGPDGRFFYANEAACRSLGYTRKELTSLRITDIDPDFPREPWATTWKRVQQQSQPRSHETRHLAKGGRVFPVEITATYLNFDGREFVCTFARDITTRKQLESQLRQSQKMEAVGQLTAGIAHNFNNMLQVISGNLHLIHDQVPPLLRTHLADAEESAGRAADMVRQLMVFARPTGPHHPQPLDLAALLRHILAICRPTFDQRIQLDARISPQLPQAKGHTGQLEQVLLNLLINARDALELATSAAEPRICTALQLAAAEDLPADLQPGAYLRLQVSDNGVGMDEDTQTRVFEPFFTTKPVGKGTGLGLATVYAIVQEHRGRITCESRVGEGTTFSVYLPALDSPAAAPSQAPEPAASPKGTETLLLIDDEELVRRTLGRGLEKAGYRILEGANGMEGLEILQREGADIALVLLDLSMPGMSGLEVLERLRLLERRPKVVLLTGYAAESSQYAGADQVLQKPLKLSELVRRVRQVLDR
jgi:PAS domain S-box-containing protein